MLSWIDQGYNLSTVTWQSALVVGHSYQIFMHNAAQPGSYTYSQQFVFDPTSFIATNAAVNHVTGQFSFDYSSYNGGAIMAVSLRNDRPASSYNWPAGQIGYGPLSCTATHCSGTSTHLTGTIACSDNLIFDIFDGSNEYFSGNFTVSHIDIECQVPKSGSDWPTFQKNPQHTGFAESETQLAPPFDTLWSLDTGSVNYQSMVVAGDTMYVGGAGLIRSINASNGTINWSVATSSSERLTYANDTLYSVGGCQSCTVQARNPANGQLIWSSSVTEITSGITVGGNRVYIGTSRAFRALDAATGAQVWGYPTFDPIFAWPALMAGNDNIVYAGVYQNSPNLLALYESSPGVGSALWTSNRLLGAATPTALKGKLYWANSGSSGVVVALDANNGGQLWNNFSVLGGNTATAVAYNTVYARGHGGRVTAVDAATGQTKWIYNDGATGDLHTPVVVANNVVYEPTFNNKINALDAQTGALLWQYTTPSKVTALIVANHMLLVGTETGKILAFGDNSAPKISALAGTTLDRSGTYTETGSFTDLGSSSWTATVDYGDGAGATTLPLSDHNFTLTHQYNTPGTYYVVVTVTDNQGLAGTTTATVYVVVPPGPSVTNAVVNPSTIIIGQTAFLSATVSGGTQSVVAAEYFEGADPGEGQGEAMTVQGNTATTPLPSNLALGTHTFTVRAKDSAGNWTQAGLPTATLTVVLPVLNGRVLNGANEGLSGVQVNIVNPSNNAIVAATTTNSSGNYSVSVDPGIYDVTITPTGNVYSPTTKTGIDLTANYTLDVVLALAPHTFKGTLKDKNGTAIVGASLSLHNQGGQTFTATTDGTGAFTAAVNPATYSLTITYLQLGAPTAFVPSQFTLTGGAFDLTNDVERNFVINTVALTLTSKSELTNAAVGNVHLGVAASTATEVYPGSGTYTGSASYNILTDSFGVVSIPVLTGTTYSVNATPPTGQGVIATQFGANGPIAVDTQRDLALDADIAHFSGTFTDNATVPAGIPGATVRINGPLGNFQATTNANGDFSIEAAAGTYNVTVNGSKPGGSTLRIPDSYSFSGASLDLTGGDVVHNLTLDAAQVDVAAKTSFGATLSDVNVLLSGVPASVELYPGGVFTATSSSSKSTGPSGVASLYVTKGLAYSTKATPQAGSGYIVTNMAAGSVVSSDTAWDIILNRDLKHFTGVVQDKNGAAVKGAQVRVDGNEADQHYSVSTDDSGSFDFWVAPNPAYTLQISGTQAAAPTAFLPDNFSLSTTLGITADSTKNVTVEAVDLGIVARDNRLMSIPMVNITFASSGSQNGFSASSSNIARITDGNGHAQLRMLKGTTYTISATPPPLIGYVTTTFNGTSPIMQNTEVIIEFQNHIPLKPTGLTAQTPTNTSPALSWNAVDNADHYKVYRDGTFIGLSNTTSFTDSTLTADGPYEYKVSAVSADNYEGPKSDGFTVFYDTTPPTIDYTIAPEPNAAGWNNANLVVTFTCDDVNGSGVANCTSAVPVTGETPGLDVPGTAVDNAGNSASKIAHVKLDKTAPVPQPPTWTANPVARGAATTLNVLAPDPGNLSGLASGEYFIDNDPGIGLGTPMTVNGNNLSATLDATLQAGVYKIGIRARDAAGNWSAPIFDYLVVYDPSINLGVIGRSKELVPSLANGDVLPGLTSSSQTDTAEYGMTVDYKNDSLDPRNDFRFSYNIGTQCNSPHPLNCHSFDLNAINFSWLLIDQANSRGRFQGVATLVIDGTTSTNPFTVEGIDGQQLTPAGNDTLTLKIFAPGDNPATATPLYRVTSSLARQNAVEIR